MKSCIIEWLCSYENNLEIFDVSERLFAVITLFMQGVFLSWFVLNIAEKLLAGR